MSINNITVKDSDGTTDRVFTALVQPSGDGTNFVWQNAASHAVPKYRTTITGVAKYNGTRTARRMSFNSSFPYVTVDVNKGNIPVFLGKGIVEISFLKPEDLPQANWDAQVDQTINFLATPAGRALVKAMFA